VRQSKIAIGSGGIIGKGFLKGTQTRGKYVPEQHTDFIFTSLGEAFGFVGCFLFLGLYLLLLFRIIWIAERQRSAFSRVYAYCIASIIFFHIAVNVCMTIGLFPIIGIPLPMISYGGSSLLTFTVLIFILVRLDADRQMVLR
jgi:rod shape determining protein RodA